MLHKAFLIIIINKERLPEGKKVKIMVIGVIVVIVAILLVSNIKIVPQARSMVIERLGQYSSTWEAGIHIKIPFIDRIVKKVSLKEQVYDFPPQKVITKDNVSMGVDSVVYAKIFDVKKYTYGVEDPMLGLQNLTATTLRSVIGNMELDTTLSSREEINAKMQETLDKATDEWGLKVTRVELKNITPPREIEEAMTKQMKAERERREAVLQAQAHKESVVTEAEGDKAAKIMAAEAERDAAIALAEGKAKSIELVYDAEADGLKKIANAGVNDAVLRLKSIEAMKDVSDGRATKIFIPNDLGKSLSSFGVMGEMLGTAPEVKDEVDREDYRKSLVETDTKQQLEKDACFSNPSSNATTLKSVETNARNSSEMRQETER